MTPEAAASLRGWLAHVAAQDPERQRFGARHHGYRLAAPLTRGRLAELEQEIGTQLPASYRDFLVEVADGGAGPYHGLCPLDHPIQRRVVRGVFPLQKAVAGAGPAEHAGRALYRGVVGLGHLGCGLIAFLVVHGPATGQVWLDLRGADEGVVPAYPDFSAYLQAWIARVAVNQLPEPWVPPGRCALPAALSAFLSGYETRHGLPAGSLAGSELRAAFRSIGLGSIRCATTGDDPFFEPDEPIDPCARCEQMIENLIAEGLRRDQLALGVPPRPMRDQPV